MVGNSLKHGKEKIVFFLFFASVDDHFSFFPQLMMIQTFFFHDCHKIVQTKENIFCNLYYPMGLWNLHHFLLEKICHWNTFRENIGAMMWGHARKQIFESTNWKAHACAQAWKYAHRWMFWKRWKQGDIREHTLKSTNMKIFSTAQELPMCAELFNVDSKRNACV